MHTVLNKLEAESKIEKIKKGEYTLKIEINNGEGDSIQGS